MKAAAGTNAGMFGVDGKGILGTGIGGAGPSKLPPGGILGATGFRNFMKFYEMSLKFHEILWNFTA